MNPQMRDIEYQHTNQRTPCVIVVDVSQSMSLASKDGQQRKIDLLNQGVKAFYDDLMADETAKHRVRISIVMVGGPTNQAELMMDWTDAYDFVPMEFHAQGLTPLGQGMSMAVDLVEAESLQLRQNGINLTRPWILVLSDGMPTDTEVWPDAVSKCHQAEKEKRCVIYPIGVEVNNDQMAVLQQLSATPAMHLSAYKFREFFLWLSASLKAVSYSAPGDTVQLASVNPWATTSA